jgi:hypothetical protein
MLYLGVGFPAFLVLSAGIVLFAAVLDRLSFLQALECLQGVVPVCLTYVGAILGFAFTGRLPEFMTRAADGLQQKIRVYVSLLLSSALMLSHVSLTLVFVCGKMELKDYKIGTSIIMWVLAATVSFIVGKYFGDSVELAHGPAIPEEKPDEPKK